MTSSRHHRRPRSINGSDAAYNISLIPHHKHKAWHVLFENMSAHAIARAINDLYLDPAWAFVVVRRD